MCSLPAPAQPKRHDAVGLLDVVRTDTRPLLLLIQAFLVLALSRTLLKGKLGALFRCPLPGRLLAVGVGCRRFAFDFLHVFDQISLLPYVEDPWPRIASLQLLDVDRVLVAGRRLALGNCLVDVAAARLFLGVRSNELIFNPTTAPIICYVVLADAG